MIPDLYQLDPTQFALGRGTGKFRAVTKKSDSLDAQGDIVDILNEIKRPIAAPTVPNIDKSKLPTAPSLDPQIMKDVDAAKAKLTNIFNQYYNLEGGKDYFGILMNNGATALQASEADLRKRANYLAYQYNPDPSWKQYEKAMAEVNLAKSMIAQDAIIAKNKTAVDAYNTQVASYKKAIAPYQAQIDQYKKDKTAYDKDVERYRGEINKASDTFMAQRQKEKADIFDPNIQAEGQQLAGTDLYSDQLHQMMLKAVGTANSEPTADTLTSIYSR